MANTREQYTYKNTSERHQVLVGVGEFEPGATFTTFDRVSNPNFTLVTTSKADKKAKAAEAAEAPMQDRATPQEAEDNRSK